MLALSQAKWKPMRRRKLSYVAATGFVIILAIPTVSGAGSTDGVVRLAEVRQLGDGRIHATWTRDGQEFLAYEGNGGGRIVVADSVPAVGQVGTFEVTYLPAGQIATLVATPRLPYRAAIPGITTPRHEGLRGGYHVTEVLVPKPLGKSGSADAQGQTITAATWASLANLATTPGSPVARSTTTVASSTTAPSTGRAATDGIPYRTGNPSYEYLADAATGQGYGKNTPCANEQYTDRCRYSSPWFNHLVLGAEQIAYQNGQTIDWSPNGKVGGTSPCGSKTFSVSIQGVTVSSTSSVCKDYILGADNNRSFNMEWHGCTDHDRWNPTTRTARAPAAPLRARIGREPARGSASRSTEPG